MKKSNTVFYSLVLAITFAIIIFLNGRLNFLNSNINEPLNGAIIMLVLVALINLKKNTNEKN